MGKQLKLTAWIEDKGIKDFRLTSAYVDKKKGGNDEIKDVR